MDLSGLYELIERFHRSNQLPAFLIGAVAALAGAYFLLKYSRLRILSDAARDGEIKGLLKDVNSLTAEKNQWRNELNHVEKHAEALRTRLFELIGRQQAQAAALKVISADRERLREKLLKREQERKDLLDRYQKVKRFASKLNSQLDRIAVSDGRIWEAPPETGVAPFRPLSQRRTPILSLVNLKGGVGKTTIAANLAVAMSKHRWRVLLVDLDHQSSLSQLLLSPAEMSELLVSRRLVHEALRNATDGLAAFRQAIVRVTVAGDSEIWLVAADEELGNLETAISERWQLKIAEDDVRYRLRKILHSEEIAERFDFILLDCPPRLTTACVNALAASDYVMIPVLPNPLATAAVPRLLRWLQHLRRAACPELSVIGVIGNKTKYFRDAPVKKQQAELDSLAGLCQEQWGEPVRFFPAVRLHDPLVHPLPALDPALGAAYLDLVHELNKGLPHYARSRSPELSQSACDPVGSVRG
jgi:cellulose biosynthesis protein BcsQ